MEAKEEDQIQLIISVETTPMGMVDFPSRVPMIGYSLKPMSSLILTNTIQTRTT